MKSTSSENPAKRNKPRKNMPLVVDEVAVAAKLEMIKAVDDRRYRVAKLYISGRRPAQIGRIVGVTTDMVLKDLHVVRKDWIGLATQDILKWREEEVARLLNEQADAEEAYQLSKEQRTVTRATKNGPGGQPVTSAMTFRRPDGDPRWKAQVLKCIEARCRLLGLNLQPEEPMQQIHQHNTINLTNVSLHELKRIRGELLELAGGDTARAEQGNLQTQPV